MSGYFTDREYGQRPPSIDTIDARVWGGLFTLIDVRIFDGSFGYRFPEYCSDGGNENAPCGCDKEAFDRALAAVMPFLNEPLSPNVVPDTPVVMDILEFCAATVGHPESIFHHSYMRHNHLNWDRPEGLARFVADVNMLFARNAVAFELSADGRAKRLLPTPVADTIGWTLFNTGDADTNQLLEVARTRITSPKPEDRQQAIEKLWDAFERLKTLEPGSGKRAQAEALLGRVSQTGTSYRTVLDAEAAALTSIGNQFQIRHWETDKSPLVGPDQLDYLFIRMFAFVRLLLKSTGRGG